MSTDNRSPVHRHSRKLTPQEQAELTEGLNRIKQTHEPVPLHILTLLAQKMSSDDSEPSEADDFDDLDDDDLNDEELKARTLAQSNARYQAQLNAQLLLHGFDYSDKNRKTKEQVQAEIQAERERRLREAAANPHSHKVSKEALREVLKASCMSDNINVDDLPDDMFEEPGKNADYYAQNAPQRKAVTNEYDLAALLMDDNTDFNAPGMPHITTPESVIAETNEERRRQGKEQFVFNSNRSAYEEEIYQSILKQEEEKELRRLKEQRRALKQAKTQAQQKNQVPNQRANIPQQQNVPTVQQQQEAAQRAQREREQQLSQQQHQQFVQRQESMQEDRLSDDDSDSAVIAKAMQKVREIQARQYTQLAKDYPETVAHLLKVDLTPEELERAAKQKPIDSFYEMNSATDDLDSSAANWYYPTLPPQPDYLNPESRPVFKNEQERARFEEEQYVRQQMAKEQELFLEAQQQYEERERAAKLAHNQQLQAKYAQVQRERQRQAQAQAQARYEQEQRAKAEQARAYEQAQRAKAQQLQAQALAQARYKQEQRAQAEQVQALAYEKEQQARVQQLQAQAMAQAQAQALAYAQEQRAKAEQVQQYRSEHNFTSEELSAKEQAWLQQARNAKYAERLKAKEQAKNQGQVQQHNVQSQNSHGNSAPENAHPKQPNSSSQADLDYGQINTILEANGIPTAYRDLIESCLKVAKNASTPEQVQRVAEIKAEIEALQNARDQEQNILQNKPLTLIDLAQSKNSGSRLNKASRDQESEITAESLNLQSSQEQAMRIARLQNIQKRRAMVLANLQNRNQVQPQPSMNHNDYGSNMAPNGNIAPQDMGKPRSFNALALAQANALSQEQGVLQSQVTEIPFNIDDKAFKHRYPKSYAQAKHQNILYRAAYKREEVYLAPHIQERKFIGEFNNHAPWLKNCMPDTEEGYSEFNPPTIYDPYTILLGDNLLFIDHIIAVPKTLIIEPSYSSWLSIDHISGYQPLAFVDQDIAQKHLYLNYIPPQYSLNIYLDIQAFNNKEIMRLVALQKARQNRKLKLQKQKEQIPIYFDYKDLIISKVKLSEQFIAQLKMAIDCLLEVPKACADKELENGKWTKVLNLRYKTLLEQAINQTAGQSINEIFRYLEQNQSQTALTILGAINRSLNVGQQDLLSL